MKRLVGFVPLPLSVDATTRLLAAYARTFPGCTVGEARQTDVPLGDEGTWRVTCMPIFTDEP